MLYLQIKITRTVNFFQHKPLLSVSYLQAGDSSSDSEVIPITARFKIKDAKTWRMVIQELVEANKLET